MGGGDGQSSDAGAFRRRLPEDKKPRGLHGSQLYNTSTDYQMDAMSSFPRSSLVISRLVVGHDLPSPCRFSSAFPARPPGTR